MVGMDRWYVWTGGNEVVRCSFDSVMALGVGSAVFDPVVLGPVVFGPAPNKFGGRAMRGNTECYHAGWTLTWSAE